MTLIRSTGTKSDSERFYEQASALNDHEQRMLTCLDGDIDAALEATRPLLGIFPRRGHIPFVILREDVAYSDGFRKARIRQSRLTIDRNETITLEDLNRLTRLVQLKRGIRLNGLECTEPCPIQAIDAKFYTYRVDLEAL